MRQRAFGLVAVIDAANHAQAVVGEGSEVEARGVLGVVAHGFGEDNPAGLRGLEHELLAAGFVDTEDEIGFVC